VTLHVKTTATMSNVILYFYFLVKDASSLTATLRLLPSTSALDGAQPDSKSVEARARPTAANTKKRSKGKGKGKGKGKQRDANADSDDHAESDGSTTDTWTPLKSSRRSGTDGMYASDSQFAQALAALGPSPASPTATLQSELTGLYNLRALCPEAEKADFDPAIAVVKAKLLSGLGITTPPAAVATAPQVQPSSGASSSR
jgi:hypothetical protein